MSSNFSNFDLLFNVEPGKKLTKAQLLKNYEQLKAQNNIKGSIFEEDMEDVIGEMFEVLNIEKAENDEEDFLNDNEVAALKSYFDDGDDNSKVSSNDMNELRKKAIDNINKKIKAIEISTPEEMYQKALKEANGDMTQSSYVMDLSNNIESLTSLIILRQQNSNEIISKYEQKINELIQKSTNLSDEFKAKYDKMTKEAETLQKQMQETEAKIQSNQQKIDELNQEQSVIQSQLSSMSDEEKENNLALIEQRNSEISAFQSNSAALVSENAGLSSKISKYSARLTKISQQKIQMQSEAETKDVSLKKEINSYKAKIEEEKLNCQKDINQYTLQINALKAAKDYAVKQTSYTVSSSCASHQNDNLLSFDDLKSQGLKYSSEKGQRLAADVSSHRVGFTGYCARYVADGLRRTGLGKERANATDMDNLLVNNSNYRMVKITSKEQLRSLPAGCIVVYERGAAGYNAKYGHIEVTMGDGTAVSDGVTRNMRYSENMTVFVPVERA